MKIENIIHKLHDRIPAILGSEHFFKYAVLLPLVNINGEVHVLFEVRSHQLRRQPGEICFPGGRIDKSDKSEQHAAVRETIEELGIQENAITNILPLDYIVSPFGTMIYPFVGMITNPDGIQPNPSEVAEVFAVPLSYFQETKPEIYKMSFKVEPEQSFPFHLIAGGENYNWQTRAMDEYFYHYEDKVIWGLTARILHHFVELLDEK
jgi:coenzyme A diphosphatase NUDT7